MTLCRPYNSGSLVHKAVAHAHRCGHANAHLRRCRDATSTCACLCSHRRTCVHTATYIQMVISIYLFIYVHVVFNDWCSVCFDMSSWLNNIQKRNVTSMYYCKFLLSFVHLIFSYCLLFWSLLHAQQISSIKNSMENALEKVSRAEAFESLYIWTNFFWQKW